MDQKSTNTHDYLTAKSITDLKKEKAPHLAWHVILILLGFILIGLGTVQIDFGGYGFAPGAKAIFESLGQALIVGTAISMILDLPFMQKYYKSRIIDVLVGNEYLNSLPHDELQRLRKECTEKMYLRKTKHFEPTLLELDEKISELLTQPYISKYRVEISCYYEATYIRKRASIKYWIQNPLTSQAVDTFPGRVLLYAIEGVAKEDLFKMTKLLVKVDDEKTLNLTNVVGYQFNDENNEFNPGHTYAVGFIDTSTTKPFSFQFSKCLEVEIEDERRVPLTDNIYTKRINLPTKNFQIHYSVLNASCKLQGACLGTMIGNPIGEVRTVTNETSISIESFDWLLPGNGIMIATIPR